MEKSIYQVMKQVLASILTVRGPGNPMVKVTQSTTFTAHFCSTNVVNMLGLTESVTVIRDLLEAQTLQYKGKLFLLLPIPFPSVDKMFIRVD